MLIQNPLLIKLSLNLHNSQSQTIENPKLVIISVFSGIYQLDHDEKFLKFALAQI